MDNNNQGGQSRAGGFKTPYVPNAMDDRKLGLTAPPVEGAKMPATLRFSFPNGNPRGVVDFGPGLPSIAAKMDLLDFYRLLEMVKQIVQTPDECRWQLTVKAPTFTPSETGGFPKRGPVEQQATVMVGRSGKGTIYISILSPDDARPKVRFYFGQGMFSHISTKTGEPLTDAQVSNLTATAWITMYTHLLANAHFHTWKPREPKEQQGGGFRKEYPPKSAGGNTPPAGDKEYFDDDIPY